MSALSPWGEELSAGRPVGSSRFPRRPSIRSSKRAARSSATGPSPTFSTMVMTFRDYKEASDKAAAGFQKLGVKPGRQCRTLPAQSRRTYIIAFFGVLKAGGKVVNYSPLDACARARIQDRRDSETDILVTFSMPPRSTLKMARDARQDAAQEAGRGIESPTICRGPRTGSIRSPRRRKIAAWPRDDWHLSFKDLLANDGRYTALSGGREPVGRGGAAAIYRRHDRPAQGRHADARCCIIAAMSQGQAWTTPYHHAGHR